MKDIYVVVVLVLTVIALVLLYFLYYLLKNEITNNGIPLIVQQSTATAATDVMVLGGNTLYIGRSKNELLLLLSANANNISGRTFEIRNAGTANIVLDTTQVTVDPGGINNATTIPPGTDARFVFITTNQSLRLT